MHLDILQDLQHLSFEGAPTTERTIHGSLKLTTNGSTVGELVDGTLQASMGESHAFWAKRCVAHLLLQSDHPDPGLTRQQVTTKTEEVIEIGQYFLEALWLVKDNSGNTGPAFAAGSYPLEARRRTQYIPHSVINSDAGCDRGETNFSLAELDTALRYFSGILAQAPSIDLEARRPRLRARTYKSRLGRALYAVQPARATSDLGMKAAHYCIALETLFSTDSAGVGHRVAERAARFVSSDGSTQQQVYSDIHRLYGYRSTVVHGSKLKDSDDAEIHRLVVAGDGYLRQSLSRLIDNSELADVFVNGNEKALKDYFMGQLFPAH